MTWVEDQINNEEIFPVQESAAFPEDFQEVYVRNIFKRLFRVFAIIYVSALTEDMEERSLTLQ